jgi:hypothetical protein
MDTMSIVKEILVKQKNQINILNEAINGRNRSMTDNLSFLIYASPTEYVFNASTLYSALIDMILLS